MSEYFPPAEYSIATGMTASLVEWGANTWTNADGVSYWVLCLRIPDSGFPEDKRWYRERFPSEKAYNSGYQKLVVEDKAREAVQGV